MKAIRVLIAVTNYLIGFAIGCVVQLLMLPLSFIINLIKVIRYA